MHESPNLPAVLSAVIYPASPILIAITSKQGAYK